MDNGENPVNEMFSTSVRKHTQSANVHKSHIIKLTQKATHRKRLLTRELSS